MKERAQDLIGRATETVKQQQHLKQKRHEKNSSMKTLVVHYHPREDSLGRAAADRVIAGLTKAESPLRVLDLTADFDPVLTLEEWQRFHSSKSDHSVHANETGELDEHFEALQWATRLILVHPTWHGGQPAEIKGWFDRVWMNGIAWELPEGKQNLRGLLKNIRRIEIVTTHGSSRLINTLQGDPGRITVFRNLRMMCHPLCRTRWNALYKVDRQTPEAITAWLDSVEERFGQ